MLTKQSNRSGEQGLSIVDASLTSSQLRIVVCNLALSDHQSLMIWSIIRHLFAQMSRASHHTCTRVGTNYYHWTSSREKSGKKKVSYKKKIKFIIWILLSFYIASGALYGNREFVTIEKNFSGFCCTKNFQRLIFDEENRLLQIEQKLIISDY